MTIVDWAFAGANLLWIIGLSLIVAAFSYHVWLSQESGRRLVEELTAASWHVAVNVGLSLAAVSITVMPRNERWWTRLAALVLALAFAFRATLDQPDS